jgi:hypothetical protein
MIPRIIHFAFVYNPLPEVEAQRIDLKQSGMDKFLNAQQ